MTKTITIPRDAYEFDCTAYPEMERLAVEFCQEIAGRRGEAPSPPDPVRLLEMAHEMLKAAVEDPVTIEGYAMKGEGDEYRPRQFLPVTRT